MKFLLHGLSNYHILQAVDLKAGAEFGLQGNASGHYERSDDFELPPVRGKANPSINYLRIPKEIYDSQADIRCLDNDRRSDVV